MQNNIGKVVVMTNITQEDFTHSYGGHPFTVKAGESITFPFDVGEHLARHLARKILISKDAGATVWDPKDTTSNGGNGTPLFNEENEITMMKKILGDSFMVEQEAEKTQMDKMLNQIEELNSFRREVEEGKITSGAENGVLSRKELFAKAKELGIKVELTMTNDDLRKAIDDLSKEKES